MVKEEKLQAVVVKELVLLVRSMRIATAVVERRKIRAEKKEEKQEAEC